RNGKLERQGDRYVIEYKLDEHTTETPTSPSVGPKADNRTRNAVKNLPPIQGVSQTKTHEHHVSARIVIERVDQSEEMELTVVPVGHGSQGAVPYAAWIPEGTDREEMEGSWVELKATLKTRSGKPVPTDHRAATVIFELTEV